MTSIKAVEIGLPLGGTVWYKNVQQNGPSVADNRRTSRRSDGQQALMLANNLRHKVVVPVTRVSQLRLMALAA
jgi:hypothetical protein